MNQVAGAAEDTADAGDAATDGMAGVTRAAKRADQGSGARHQGRNLLTFGS